MIKLIFSILIIPFILWSLTLISWPDLPTEIETSITTITQMIYSFNTVFPIDTIFLLGGLAMLINLGFFLYKLALRIASHATGSNQLQK